MVDRIKLQIQYYRFSRPFSSPLHKIKCVFNFVPDTLEYANTRFNFVFGRSILKHSHSVSCFVTRFRQLQFKFVGHSIAEHKTAKSISSIGIHFRQSFTQNRLPDIKAHYNTWRIWMAQIMNLFEKIYEFDPSIPNSHSGIDEFQNNWRI